MSTEPGPASLRSRLDQLELAVRARSDLVPALGLVLGSGLGGVGDAVESPVAIPFADLPGWPAPTAPGHAGRLLLGRISGVPVVEPVLLMGRLGARTIALTNAAGGVNRGYAAGTLMVISDHLNLTGRSPLLGPNDDAAGPRFTDLTDVWEPELRRRIHAAGEREGVALEEGVYAGLLGPTYETPAEVRMLKTLGADAVGMSTVMEAIAARWAGLRVCGVSLVTNPGAGISDHPLSHQEVLEAAAEAGPRLARVLRRFVSELG